MCLRVPLHLSVVLVADLGWVVQLMLGGAELEFGEAELQLEVELELQYMLVEAVQQRMLAEAIQHT